MLQWQGAPWPWQPKANGSKKAQCHYPGCLLNTHSHITLLATRSNPSLADSMSRHCTPQRPVLTADIALFTTISQYEILHRQVNNLTATGLCQFMAGFLRCHQQFYEQSALSHADESRHTSSGWHTVHSVHHAHVSWPGSAVTSHACLA